MIEKEFIAQDNYFNRWADQLCRDVSHLSELDLTKDSPLYNLQQQMIKHCRIYQASKNRIKK